MVLSLVEVSDVDANSGTYRHGSNGHDEETDKEVGYGRLMLRPIRIKLNVTVLAKPGNVFHVSCS